MAVKYANMFNGVYTGRMGLQQVGLIQNIQNTEVIPALKNYIYVFPPEILVNAMESGVGALKYCTDNGISTSSYRGELRDYQTVGVGFMYYSPRSILADGVGLGKTVEISGLLNVLRVKKELTKFLIAVETSAVGQVQSELMKFTGLNVITLPSLSDKFKKAVEKVDWDAVDGVVIKHSLLRSDAFSFWLSQYIDDTGKCKLFNTFILDESSVVKNEGTKMYNYTTNICNSMSRVHFLNATAFEICLLDIYNQLDIIDPDVLPKKWRIEKEYCTYGWKPYWKKEAGVAVQKYSRKREGYKNQETFKQSIQLYYFGRAKEVALGVSENEYKVYTVEPTTDQLVAIKRKYRYMEVLNCPSLVDGIKINFDRQSVPKLDRLLSLVENEFSNSKVMVYCFHIEAQKVIKDALEEIGKKVVILNGETKDADRNGIMDSFNIGDTDVIVTNIKKSLNLYNGDVCIFYSMETNPAQMEQIHGRIDRNVDDKKKTYIMLVYQNTPELEYLTSVVAERGRDARALTIDAKSTIDYFMDSMK